MVCTVRSHATIREALSLLSEAGVGALVVSEDEGRIDGIISERDIVRGMHQVGTRIFEMSVAELMSGEVRTCKPDDAVEALAEQMTEWRIRHVPVEDEGKLVGIVSIGDVVKCRIAQLELARFELLEYVSAR
jgi:CBS domain-containing protein